MKGTPENFCSDDEEILAKRHLADIKNTIPAKKRHVFERHIQDEGHKVVKEVNLASNISQTSNTIVTS